jgi:hypothetical protein
VLKKGIAILKKKISAKIVKATTNGMSVPKNVVEVYKQEPLSKRTQLHSTVHRKKSRIQSTEIATCKIASMISNKPLR